MKAYHCFNALVGHVFGGRGEESRGERGIGQRREEEGECSGLKGRGRRTR